MTPEAQAYDEIRKAIRVRRGVLWRMRSRRPQQRVDQALMRVEAWVNGHTTPSKESLQHFLLALGHELRVVVIGSKAGDERLALIHKLIMS